MATSTTKIVFESSVGNFYTDFESHQGYVLCVGGKFPPQRLRGDFDTHKDAHQLVVDQQTGYSPWDSLPREAALAEVRQLGRWRRLETLFIETNDPPDALTSFRPSEEVAERDRPNLPPGLSWEQKGVATSG